MATKPRSNRRPVVLTEPRDIKALGHPARLAVLDEFFSGRELTATECAEIVGISPSAMSYHLRALERVGIIERAGVSGDGRRRPWRAAGTELQISPQSVAATAAVSALVTHDVLARMTTELTEWFARGQREHTAWRDASAASFMRLWLSRQEAEELQKLVMDYLDSRHARDADERPAGARRVRIGFFMFPLEEPPQKPDGAAT